MSFGKLLDTWQRVKQQQQQQQVQSIFEITRSLVLPDEETNFLIQ